MFKNIFKELSIEYRTEVIIGEGEYSIPVPFLFTSSNIKYEGEIVINQNSVYEAEYRYKKSKDILINEFLCFVDFELLTFDLESVSDLSGSGIEFIKRKTDKDYILASPEDFYILLDVLEVSKEDIYKMKLSISKGRSLIANKIINLVMLMFENKSKSIEPTQDFMQVQALVEFSTSSVIFRENVGKACEDWSFREVFLRTMYISRKYEIEKMQRDKLDEEMEARRNSR